MTLVTVELVSHHAEAVQRRFHRTLVVSFLLIALYFLIILGVLTQISIADQPFTDFPRARMFLPAVIAFYFYRLTSNYVVRRFLDREIRRRFQAPTALDTELAIHPGNLTAEHLIFCKRREAFVGQKLGGCARSDVRHHRWWARCLGAATQHA